MSSSSPRGTCLECRQVYRVPAADRTYRCKACGGTVEVLAASPAPSPSKASSGRAMPRRSGGAGGRSAPPRPVRSGGRTGGRAGQPRERRAPKRSSKKGLGLALGAVALAAVGFGLWRSGGTVVAGGGRDIAVATAAFVEAWEAGDLDGMTGFRHPTQRAEFRARLGHLAERSGWKSGFPKITVQASGENEGLPYAAQAAEDTETATTALRYEGEERPVLIRWQYEPTRTRWFIYDFDVPSPALKPYAESFWRAWMRGDGAAVAEAFRPDAAKKMGALLARETEKLGDGGKPRTGEIRVVGDELASSQVAAFLGRGKVESFLKAPDGREFMARWRFLEDNDRWVVTGFRFP